MSAKTRFWKSGKVTNGNTIMIYADTSVLVAILVNDSNTAEALDILSYLRKPLAYNRLLKLEIGNALRLKLANRILRDRDVSEAEHTAEEYVNTNRWVEVEPIWERVLDRARGLSMYYTKQTHSRSLDIMHVACAMELQVSHFVSFDVRQRDLAEKVGMRVI